MKLATAERIQHILFLTSALFSKMYMKYGKIKL